MVGTLGHWPPFRGPLSSDSAQQPPGSQRKPHTHSSCRRCICSLCIYRSRRSCRSHLQNGDGHTARSECDVGDSSPQLCSFNLLLWVGPSPGNSCPVENKPNLTFPALLRERAGRFLAFIPQGGSQAPNSAQGDWVWRPRPYVLSPEEAKSPASLSTQAN